MYKIIITETTQVEGVTKREWERGGPDGTEDDSDYGYTPQISELRKETRTVLEMMVEHLDTAPVIMSILEASIEP